MTGRFAKTRVGFLDHYPKLTDAQIAAFHGLLMMAPYTGPDAGKVRTSRTQIAARFGWSGSKVSRTLASLEKLEYVTLEKARNGSEQTTITIRKFFAPAAGANMDRQRCTDAPANCTDAPANCTDAPATPYKETPNGVSKKEKKRVEDAHEDFAPERVSIGDLMQDLEEVWPGPVTNRTERHVEKFLQRPEIDPERHGENVEVLRRMIADVPSWQEHYLHSGEKAPNLFWWISDYRPDAKFGTDPTIAYLQECERQEREREESRRRRREQRHDPDLIPLPVDRHREPDGDLTSIGDLARMVNL